MTMHTDTLDWPLMVLAHLDSDFTVEGPPELADLVGRAAARFARSAHRMYAVSWALVTPF